MSSVLDMVDMVDGLGINGILAFRCS